MFMLGGLPHLATLSVSQTNVSDKGLLSIMTRSKSIDILKAKNTSISEAGIKSARQVRPTVTIFKEVSTSP
jgi:hypothetical protein